MEKVDTTQFNAEKVGKLDAAMWRAYYNHQFFKLFWLMLDLVKTQLGLNWFLTIRIAYYSAWAAADYRINRMNVNNKRIIKNLTKYFKIISDHGIEPFDYVKAAKLELAWWDIHRNSYKNHPALESSLAASSAVIFNVDSHKLKRHAHYRAEAMILPRHKGDHPDNPIDWVKVEALTIKSWQSLHKAVQK